MLILKSSFLESCTNMLMCSISPWYLKGNVYLKPFLPGIIKWAIVDYFFCMIEKIMLKSWMFCANGAIKLLKLKNNNDDEYLPLGSFAQTILQKKIRVHEYIVMEIGCCVSYHPCCLFTFRSQLGFLTILAISSLSEVNVWVVFLKWNHFFVIWILQLACCNWSKVDETQSWIQVFAARCQKNFAPPWYTVWYLTEMRNAHKI